MSETEEFWAGVEERELEQARQEFLALPCPECNAEALHAVGKTGWACGNCGAGGTSDLP